jgi:hypothetical protein
MFSVRRRRRRASRRIFRHVIGGREKQLVSAPTNTAWERESPAGSPSRPSVCASMPAPRETLRGSVTLNTTSPLAAGRQPVRFEFLRSRSGNAIQPARPSSLR